MNNSKKLKFFIGEINNFFSSTYYDYQSIVLKDLKIRKNYYFAKYYFSKNLLRINPSIDASTIKSTQSMIGLDKVYGILSKKELKNFKENSIPNVGVKLFLASLAIHEMRHLFQDNNYNIVIKNFSSPFDKLASYPTFFYQKNCREIEYDAYLIQHVFLYSMYYDLKNMKFIDAFNKNIEIVCMSKKEISQKIKSYQKR